jgi:single-stranded DNA-binding protein
MNDTRITIVGTALTKPERKVLEKSGTVVANFRVISNSRRMDKGSNTWVDGSHFRIKVNCWRRMADHVVASINAGDPIFVYGRVSTREWKTDTGEARMSYELDAECVGHDLSRGVDVFTRMRHEGPNSVVDDAEADNRVNGEPTHSAGPLGLGVDELYGYDESYHDSTEDALTLLREAGLDPTPGDEHNEDDDNDEEELVGATAGSGSTAARSRRRGRAPELA